MNNTLVKILRDKNLLTIRPVAKYVKFLEDDVPQYYSGNGEWLKGYIPKSAEAFWLAGEDKICLSSC